ncbi:CaiB/BaiF CoA transferase family protein [Bordetella genomosp. 4]|uniref:CaiB/BaiF CoA transferase family protein n=1 Tax=Bordetella genomosp. 4 TaxID=463044 RepID=UPI000B9E901A|nr:CoA transferase [Bordetella genomosp. 4]OZI44339.1 hypothetical protein CAL21_17285 [Bordetella genomosp. 4]
MSGAALTWLLPGDAAGGPLAGIKVLDFTEQLPGPFLSQNMAEMGADVIKVERPQGDPTRRSSPPLFEAVNHGKRFLTADLKSETGRAAVYGLLRNADVLLEAYRPGVMERLGMGYEQLRGTCPTLVYLSLTGYGADGPHASWPGHDINYLAAAGIVDMSTESAGSVRATAVPMADLAGSVYALACVNAALFQRERSGKGQRLDIAMADCVTHWAGVRLASLRNGTGPNRPLAAYGVFVCADGRRLSIAALEDHFWDSIVHALNLEAFADERWRHRPAREAACDAINSAIASVLKGIGGAEALRRLTEADVPVFEVVPVAGLAGSTQAVARQLFFDGPLGPVCRFPVRLAGMPGAAY